MAFADDIEAGCLSRALRNVRLVFHFRWIKQLRIFVMVAVVVETERKYVRDAVPALVSVDDFDLAFARLVSCVVEPRVVHHLQNDTWREEKCECLGAQEGKAKSNLGQLLKL